MAPRRRRDGSRPRAGGVVVRMRADATTERALFLLIRDSYENWGFPKGHLETGERPEDAALREVREETGLDDLARARAASTRSTGISASAGG